MRALALVLLFAVSAAAAPNPRQTWVFAVSLARFAGDRLHDFTPADRIDGDFERLFFKQGVPRGQVVLLKDARATTAGIRRAFDRLLDRTRANDHLIFYFGSHGSYDAETGRHAFSTYDGSLAFDWAVEAVERRFHGSSALMTTDCCYSGGILDAVARVARPRVAYACLSSMDAHASGSNGWRFMRWLMRGFAGDARADLDGDGQVRLDELAQAARRELAFLRGTSPAFGTAGGFDPRTVLAPAAPAVEGAGRLVVLRDGTRAAVEREEGDHVVVRRGDDDRVVRVARARLADAPAPLPAGARVWIASSCSASEVWRPAVVSEARGPLHRCRPCGGGPELDEWVDSARMLPSTTGTWRGRYANSTGEEAATTLTLTEDERGSLSGTWDDVPVTGVRLGGKALYLEGGTARRSYRLVGSLDADQLLVTYAADRSGGGRYHGWCALAPVAPPLAAPPVRATLAGHWAGTYRNTLGQGASETLDLTESPSGDLAGTWDGVAVRGVRTGARTGYLEGRSGARLYRIASFVDGDTLALTYVAIDGPDSRYWGQSALAR